MVGFVASRSDGWFVCCYRSFGRIYGRWLACRLGYRAFDVSPFSSGWLAAVVLPYPSLRVSGQVRRISPSLSRGIPSSIAYPRIDLRTLNKRYVTCFAITCISTYISSGCIQLQVLPIPLLVMGWNRYLVTPQLVQPTHPELESWKRPCLGIRIMNFSK